MMFRDDVLCNKRNDKISKCLLLVVTVVSLVFLLFYKTQYDKLYNVLQVLKFFGNQVTRVFREPSYSGRRFQQTVLETEH
jgi:putative effector of murein hydrolase